MPRFILVLAIALMSWPSFAATFAVNNTGDSQDIVPGDGACADVDGYCSLRAAVQESNALSGTDDIALPAGTYPLTIFGRSEDAAATGDLDITDDLVITGNSAIGSIVETASGEDRVFHIIGAYSVLISKVTIQNGGHSGLYAGGGIYNEGGLLRLSKVILDGNVAANGGGIFSDHSGRLLVRNSIIRNNTGTGAGALIDDSSATFKRTTFESNSLATSSGGGLSVSESATVRVSRSTFDSNESFHGAGIYNAGTLNVDRSRFASNVSNDYGGGIWNSGTLTLRFVTVHDNTAVIGGAGLYNDGDAAVSFSTFASNTTAGSGGGIYNTTTLAIANSTLSANTASGTFGRGGGLFNYSGESDLSNLTVTLNTAPSGGGIATNYVTDSIIVRNTVISGNTGTTDAPDCQNGGYILSEGYNFIGDVSGCSYVTATGDVTGDSSGSGALDALLNSLADNGGATFTHLPDAASPLVDAGNPSGCVDASGATLTYDQRGFVYDRTLDGDSDGSAVCDIGAVEI